MNSNSSDSDEEILGSEDDESEIETLLNVEDSESAEYTEIFGDDIDDDLPPILEPPSTGYFHTVDENRPPPELHPVGAGHIDDEVEYDDVKFKVDDAQPQDDDIIEIDDSDSGKSSTTDSDDELVDVDYEENRPEKYEHLLQRYGFLATKESWVYNVRNFYKKQPSRVRRLLKMHKDADGNPLEEPVEMLFEKIHAERERMRKSQNIKCEVLEEESKDKDDGVMSVASIQVNTSFPRLVHVAYPGNVVNYDKAIATLGGTGTLSKIFEHPNKKLHLKFRPNDPFANGANAQGRTSCGLLLRVRRRKDRGGGLSDPKTTSHKTKINLESLGNDPLSTELVHDMLLDNQLHSQSNEQDDNTTTVNEKTYREPDVLLADRLITDEIDKKGKAAKAWGSGRSNEFNLKIPKIIETTKDHCLIETIGVVHRSYEFNGICDFQYLPASNKTDGNLVSIKDKIFPILGVHDNPETLVMKDLINEEIRCQTFSLPPAMSRIDNPPKGLIDELIISEKSDSATRKLPPDDSVFSNRRKRIIFTISYNFQADGRIPDRQVEVPSHPLDLALEDIERRQIKKDLVEIVRVKFEERPIWSKAALEFATKIPSQTLKYIIPSFAYFAANGPWRNTWIKFGVDPRRQLQHVIYQAVDFRVPFIYRRFMSITQKNPEANHKFLREYIPPKTQMFYQLCDIRLNEIEELIGTLKRKAETERLVYDEKFGFLKEGTYEYFRYILTYYLENLLQEHGKIPASSKPDVTFKIPLGEIEPNSKLKAAPHRRVKVKRIRKSTRKVFDPTVTPKQSKSSKVKGKKTSPTKSYQEALEDLALNDLPAQADNNDDVDYYEDDEDYGDD